MWESVSVIIIFIPKYIDPVINEDSVEDSKFNDIEEMYVMYFKVDVNSKILIKYLTFDNFLNFNSFKTKVDTRSQKSWITTVYGITITRNTGILHTELELN